MRISSICLTAFLAAAPAFCADADCTVPLEAGKKVFTTPAHGYSTRTSNPQSGQPQETEVIYTGGISGQIFVKNRGRWVHSTMTPASFLQQREENMRDSKTSCRYLRDESVNGEAAAVYTVHSNNDGIIGDGTVWVAKSRGLPLKEEIDIDTGSGPSGKFHTSTRYEYTNVRPPDAVK